ncbi:MAG: aspartate-semialdehyde dehydrogenase [Deltaproteobacteria bacterium]|nr:aspartate-semialdehyde dehydrogenase [Deltaproteobacteria bacterium]
MQSKRRVGIIGATGMVGQRFVSLLAAHPWFEPGVLAASARSAGRSYAEAVAGRWSLPGPVPEAVAGLPVQDASRVAAIAGQVDLVCCAVDLPREQVRQLEEEYARHECPVVSNNSACRQLPDVPMVVPELNPGHLEVIPQQRRRLGTRRGFIAVKPNCSLQSYLPALHPLRVFGPRQVIVCTYQAVSGAGKTLASWPAMADNVVPHIGGEEEKSEREPLKIWGSLTEQGIVPAEQPVFSAQCIRVPVSDGHLAAMAVAFDRSPAREEILAAWESFGRSTLPQQLGLPSAPQPFLQYFQEVDRPQTRLDRELGQGMAIAIGRLRPDPVLGWKLVCLSHNTLRGAAGGAVLIAELLAAQGWI